MHKLKWICKRKKVAKKSSISSSIFNYVSKLNLGDVTWQQATTQVHSFNTIAALVFHCNYFVSAVLKVFQGEPLDAHDKYSFDDPAIVSKQDWEKLLHKTWADAKNFASHIEQLPESKLWEDFSDKKYGNYYKNIHGIIEHIHYHLGQIVLIKKILLEAGENLHDNKNE